MKILSMVVLSFILGWGPKVQIIQSTSQEWFGGLQESGYGTNYKLSVKTKLGSDQLQIDELWIGDIHAKIRVLADPSNPKGTSFKKGSLISIVAATTLRPGPDDKPQLLGADSIKKPYNYKGEGLLGYTCKGRKAYLEISEFKKLEKIIYP
jgi:hypothetical protein